MRIDVCVCAQVARAIDYIGYVMAQRQGPRVVVDATHFREDLSIVDVPEVRVGCGCFWNGNCICIKEYIWDGDGEIRSPRTVFFKLMR